MKSRLPKFLWLFVAAIFLAHYVVASEEDSLNRLMKRYSQLGNYSDATEINNQLLLLHEESQSKAKLAKQLVYKAEILRASANLDLAVKTLYEAEEYIKKNKLDTVKIYLYNRKAAILFELKKNKEAAEAARTSIELGERYNEYENLTSSLILLGANHRHYTTLDSSVVYLEQAIKLASKLDDKSNLILAQHNLALSYLFYDEYEKAYMYGKNAERLVMETDLTVYKKSVMALLASYHYAVENYKQAYDYHAKMNEFENLVLNERSSQRIDLLNAEYELTKRDLENTVLRQQNEARNTQLISVLVLLLALAASAGFAFVRGRKYKILSQQVQDQNQELAKSVSFKNKLFSIIAHDIRGPIATLTGLLETHRNDGFSDQDMKEALSQLATQTKNVDLLIENLLSWTQSQRNSLQPKESNFPLSKLVAELEELFDQKLKEKELSLVLPEEKDVVYVHADMDMVRLIIRNLLSNATKFTPRGGKISIEYLRKSASNCFVIKDTGIGMSQSKIESLFSEDVGHTFGTENERGSGLGLDLVREFTELNQGSLHIESKPNEGTSITVCLPKGS